MDSAFPCNLRKTSGNSSLKALEKSVAITTKRKRAKLCLHTHAKLMSPRESALNKGANNPQVVSVTTGVEWSGAEVGYAVFNTTGDT